MHAEEGVYAFRRYALDLGQVDVDDRFGTDYGLSERL
jgi:hypothetical protein